MNDDQLRDKLEEIDNDDAIDVDTWEAKFIESVVYRQRGPMSDSQRKAAERIITRYRK